MSISRVAHDPSVADYRATSPRCAQGGTFRAYSDLMPCSFISVVQTFSSLR